MINVDELMSLPKLGKDEIFTFGCNRCGKCCREREDILLTPLDLFKIARHLKISIQDVLADYCEMYEGRDSKLPIVRIRPREYRRTCPFAKKEGCFIHPVKPAVCALYPLGRMTNYETKGFEYFLQHIKCGNNRQTQTIKKWLEEFSILNEENFTIMWHQQVLEISTILREVYEKIEFNHDIINNTLFMNLYVLYDLEKDFLPQFEENAAKVLNFIRKISDELLKKIKGGD